MKRKVHKIWEGIVGLGANILTNPPKDQFASRVPVSGTVKATNVGVWTAIFSVFGNAFVSPLQRKIDETIQVKGANIEDAGNPKNKKDKKAKKKKKG